MDTIQVRFYCHQYNTDDRSTEQEVQLSLRTPENELHSQLSADLVRDLEFVSTIHYDA